MGMFIGPESMEKHAMPQMERIVAALTPTPTLTLAPTLTLTRTLTPTAALTRT